jgi:3-methyladenine DNA glycosylase/8-oxoguanine DNA glycosylase
VTAEVPAAARHLPSPEPIDLVLSLAPLQLGRNDPTIQFRADGVWVARGTDAGSASLRLRAQPEAILAEAWGPGADAAVEAAAGLAGLLDEPPILDQHPLVADLERRFRGLRFPRTGQLVPPLVQAIIGQKVTGTEAHAAYLRLVRKLGRPAPGPVALLLPPAPADLAALPYFDYHPLGLERRRAEVIRRVGSEDARIESWLALTAAEARERLQTIRGLGPWTAAEATRLAFGDPDAVSLGDAHLPDLVAWALAREARADDERMLELLTPWAGQRARVVRLLEVSGIKIPRFGPRFAPRRIADI